MVSKVKILFWLLFLPAFAFVPGDKASVPLLAKWVITKGCTLHVVGSTNINTFSCSIEEYCHPDTIIVYKNGDKAQNLPVAGSLSLNIAAFDCHNTYMTKDLRKTLKAEDFPVMHIRFLTLNKLPDFRIAQDAVTGLVAIELAGVTKQFDMNYRFYMDSQKIIHLEGSRTITFTDFNLVPPSKLGGMIKAKDKLDVGFLLNMKVLDL